MKETINKLKFILSKKEKLTIWWLFLLMLIGGILELIGVAGVMPLVSAIVAGDIARQDTIVFMAAMLIGIYILKNIFLVFMYKRIFAFVYVGRSQLSSRLFNIYLRQPYDFHLGRNMAIIQRTIRTDVESLYITLKSLLQMLSEVIICIILAGLLFFTNPFMAATMILVIGTCIGGVYLFSKRTIRRLGKEDMAYSGKLNQWILQGLGGIKETRLLGREHYFYERFSGASMASSKNIARQQLWMQTPRMLTETVCIVVVMVWIVVLSLIGKDLAGELPVLAVFAVAAFRLLPSVGKINGLLTEYNFGKSKIDYIYEDMQGLIDIGDDELARSDDQYDMLRFSDSIELRNVGFSYSEDALNIFENVSLTIKKGESVGLIGQTGAGKTTLVDVIMGLLAPSKGAILVDGKNINDDLRGWYKLIGYVPQMIYLSDDTIRNNIAFAVDEDQIDDDRIWQVIRKAQLEDFVKGLADGLDTVVGDRGVRLSGGQRQRIGIARALYVDPEILVLDEATSALDTETESAVMDAIEALHGELTMIIIAHRVSTLDGCDSIYCLKDKEVLRESL